MLCKHVSFNAPTGYRHHSGSWRFHAFTGRTDRPFITDSGGFQVFSLKHGSVKESLESKGELKRSTVKNKSHWRSGSNAVKVTEDNVVFRVIEMGQKSF